jgi:hypothetical protein
VDATITTMNTDSPAALKTVLIVLIAGCMLLAVSAILQALSGRLLPLLIAALLWLPLAWGLWRMRPLARKIAVALLWLIAVVLPIGVINPFAAMDGAIDINTPIWQLALPVFGLVGLALFALHILGKYKTEFRHDH